MSKLADLIDKAPHERNLRIGGVRRSTYEDPGLAARLKPHGLKPSDPIPGFSVTFRELDNVCSLAQGEGWSGFIGLDEAIGSLT